MTARVFPDDRTAYRYGPTSLMSAAGAKVTVYTDQAATTLATIQTLDGLPIVGATVLVGSDSLIPEFRETTGLATLWALVEGAGAAYRMDSRLADRVALLEQTSGGGAATSRYEHHQVQPSASWVIPHNLGYPPPFLAVTDSAGSEVDGNWTSNGPTQSVLGFGSAFSGTAVVS